MSTPEGEIKKEILAWLTLKHIWHWTNQAGKIPGRRLLMTGIADILGIYNHRFLAIEVKSAKGVLMESQRIFLQGVADNGGIAIVARSREDVEAQLQKWKIA